VTRNDAVAGIDLFVDAEITRPVHDQLVKLFKRTFVEQKLDALARGHLSGGVLLLDARYAAACFRLGTAFAPRFEP
jgi:hypothetical protein